MTASRMQSRTFQTRWISLAGAIALSAFVLGMLGWFAAVSMHVGHALYRLPSIVVYEDVLGYTLGAVVGLGPLAVGGLYTTLTDNQIPTRLQAHAFKCLLGGLALMFFLNPLTGFLIENRLLAMGYELCQPASSRWLHFRKAVYVHSGHSACTNLIKDAPALAPS